MPLPSFQTYLVKFTLIDDILSVEATTEQATLPRLAQGVSLVDAISPITDMNLVHWALTSIDYLPNWVAPVALSVATSASASRAGASGASRAIK